MTGDIWQQCQGISHIKPLKGKIFRLVESQILATTMGFVDDLDEQFLLEQMIDETKPNYPPNAEHLHYLLKTPFRYPPLDWGSRFGRKHEPSLFYGAQDIDTVLAESAYYRLVFWHSMEDAPLPKNKITTEHSLFSVNYQTEHGIDLTTPPFSKFNKQLIHQYDYRVSQTLGSHMREAQVQAFNYQSARLKTNIGICTALFSPEPFTEQKPHDINQWLCETRTDKISFKRTDGNKIYRFEFELFAVDGQLPMPA